MSYYTFPESFAKVNRPSVTFSTKEGNHQTAIRFPIPAGISFAEGAMYGETDLGIIGDSIRKAAIDPNATFTNITGKGITNFKDQAVQAITGGADDSVLARSAGSSVSIARGLIVNQHKTTEFQGVGIRGFSFTFKLVPSSESEAAIIGAIVRGLRLNLYPSKSGGQDVIKYPPKWQIAFNGQQNVPNDIKDCYLESVNTTFNGGAHAWHVDGSPVETDISISFKETKALTLEDII